MLHTLQTYSSVRLRQMPKSMIDSRLNTTTRREPSPTNGRTESGFTQTGFLLVFSTHDNSRTWLSIFLLIPCIAKMFESLLCYSLIMLQFLAHNSVTKWSSLLIGNGHSQRRRLVTHTCPSCAWPCTCPREGTAVSGVFTIALNWCFPGTQNAVQNFHF